MRAGFVVERLLEVIVVEVFVVTLVVVGAGVILFKASSTAMRRRASASWATTDSRRAKFLISMVPPVGGSNTRLPFSMPTKPRVLSAPSATGEESPTIATKTKSVKEKSMDSTKNEQRRGVSTKHNV